MNILDTIITAAEPAKNFYDREQPKVADALVKKGCNECIANVVSGIVTPGKTAKTITDFCYLAEWISNNR